MILGQFEAIVGEKGRVAFPSKFRESLGSTLIITQGYENSLIIVSEKGWETLIEGTKDRPFIHADARSTQRFLLGRASDVQLDVKGRFIIPSYLRSFARIQNEVVFVGLSKYVELWDKKRWVDYNTNLEQHIDEIAKRLTEGSGNE